MAATVNVNTTFTCILQSIIWLNSGDYQVVFAMVDPAGAIKRVHSYLAKADGSGVYDENGAVIAGTTPASLVTNLTNIKTNIDTALTNAAGAGKITL